MAWNFLYAYNKSVQTVKDRLNHIYKLMNDDGHLIISLKTENDSWKDMGIKNENGTIDNPLYDAPGYIFLDRNEMVQLFDDANFELDYSEIYSRAHDMKWKERTSNAFWKDTLPIREEWYAISAHKMK